MALTLTRIDRIERTYDVTVTDANGTIPSPATAALALLPPGRSGPDLATQWTPVTVVNGSTTVILAGPDADPTGAIVVSATCDLWLRSTAAPEVDAVKIERIDVKGGGPLLPPAPTTDAVFVALLNDTTSATYAKVVALIAARAGFGNGTP